MTVELDSPAAFSYLSERHGTREITITPLGGGVSNHVLLVSTPGGDYVVKQALGRLRVEQEWLSDRNRIWREAEALRRLAPVLPAGAVPEVVYEDRENFLFAMRAVEAGRSWKDWLMAGAVDSEIARRIGRIHAALLDATWESEEWRAAFGDQTNFEQLRLDPYYTTTAARHPDLAGCFGQTSMRCRSEACALVHGDWSPKNMMVHGGQVTAIDFEVIHYGDPAFDVAFLLNHLLLKMFYRPERGPELLDAAQAYWRELGRPALAEGTLLHLPLLMLARIDGKSPADYIRDETLKTRIRAFARALLERAPACMEELFRRAGDAHRPH